MKRNKPGQLPTVERERERVEDQQGCLSSKSCAPLRLSPVEYRRLAARQQLQEVSEVGALLMKRDEEPLEPVFAIEMTRVARSAMDIKFLQKYINTMKSKSMCEKEKEEVFMKLSATISPNTLDLLLTQDCNKTKSKKGGGKSNSSRSSYKSANRKKEPAKKTLRDDPITRETPLLLHLATSLGCVEAFESMLYAMDSKSAEWANSINGHNILHLAVKSNHLHVVRSICQRVPACCRYRDLEGKLPLHLALQPKQNPVMTSTLLARYPRGMMVTDNENRLPIHTAAASAFLPGLRALLAVDPSCIRAICAPPIPEHNASSSSLTSSALYPIDMIVQYYDTVVKELDEIRTKDPILVEKKHTAEEAIEVILMTSLYGRAIFLPRDQTEAFLPLHAALLMEMRDATWRTLLTMYKNLHAEDVDELGRNLLHLVAMDPSAAGSRRQGIVREIHAMFPTAVQRENKDGLIPLQVAIMYNAGEEITKPLIEYRETTFRRRYVR